jgi:hypothetical protein
VYARGNVSERGFAGGRYGSVAGDRFGTATYYHGQAVSCRRWYGARGIWTPTWAAGHAWGWRPYGYDAAAWASAVWQTATWPALGNWIGWNTDPYDYDYGSNITLQGDNVYYGANPVGSLEQYYQGAVDLASSGGDATAGAAASNPDAAPPEGDDSQWLPLGVFGVMAKNQKTPDMTFQLAINKEGKIRGNSYDRKSDTTQPVVGAVDRKTQRVAWRTNKSDLVVETGLYNLTKDESKALVHRGQDEAEMDLLVRVKRPDDAKATSQSGAAPPVATPSGSPSTP